MEQEMKIFHDNFEDGPSSGLLFGELSLYLGEEEELEIVWDLGYFSDILNKHDGVVYPLSEVKNFIKNYEQRAGQSYYNFFSPVTIELDGDLVIFTYEMPPEIRSKYRTRSVEFLLEDLKEFIEKHENLKKVAKVKNRFIPDLSIRPEDFGINDYEFDSNGFLNTHKSVRIAGNKLTSLPFKFGKVGGDFDCTDNNLTSLEGAPKEVGGDFLCNNNNLTSLEGAPQKVGGNFYCAYSLTSLKGAPKEVSGDFHCTDNNLTSLEGAPQKVGGYFYCAYNSLTSLEGAPKEVGGNFYCADNNLTSLEGAPKEVGGDFHCTDNNLTSLEGAPQKVGGNFYCKNNKTEFTKEDVLKICDVRGKIIVHENLKKEAINADRLKVVLKEAIYGNMATVFHRTSISDLVNKIFDSGFKPGDGAMYGRGFYSTYELESQLRSNMEINYGSIIVKFACPIQTFFIFDYEEFKKSPNFKKLNSPSKKEFLKAQFEFFKMDYSDFSFKKAYYSEFTSDTALWCTKNIPNFKKLCEGIIFTGSRDGKVLVSYNTELIFPLSYTLNDGRDWEKVEKNLDYLKKVAKVKNRFIPDLTIKPEDFRINNYDFDSNGFLNVKGDVYISNENLTKLPFKLGKVEGNFWCTDNNLTSLEGSPREVERTFWCDNNNLTSLKGAPEEVGELFDCNNNNLTSLEGAPQKVGGDFYCYNNSLTSLKGAPKEVGGDFDCSDNNLTSLEEATQKVGGYFRCANNNLTSLEGAPQKVSGSFYCHNNNLTSLEGAPQKVSGSFYCYNNSLTSLKGAPKEVGGDFDCDNNNLTSLEGAPKEVGGNFNCKNNKTKFKVEDVRKVCNVKGEIIV